jgi:hypothetical protein
VTEQPMHEETPYWITQPVEPRHCLLCAAPGTVHCTLELQPRRVLASRGGKCSLYLFALCQPCADRAHARLRLIETVLEMNHK